MLRSVLFGICGVFFCSPALALEPVESPPRRSGTSQIVDAICERMAEYFGRRYAREVELVVGVLEDAAEATAGRPDSETRDRIRDVTNSLRRIHPAPQFFELETCDQLQRIGVDFNVQFPPPCQTIVPFGPHEAHAGRDFLVGPIPAPQPAVIDNLGPWVPVFPPPPHCVLMQFDAPWCGPCQKMGPIVTKLQAEGYPVRKVDVEKHPHIARQHDVLNIPTFVLIVNGQEQDRIQGLTTEQRLRGLLAKGPVCPACPPCAQAACNAEGQCPASICGGLKPAACGLKRIAGQECCEADACCAKESCCDKTGSCQCCSECDCSHCGAAAGRRVEKSCCDSAGSCQCCADCNCPHCGAAACCRAERSCCDSADSCRCCQECACSHCGAADRKITVRHVIGKPILSKVPHIAKLFKNTGVAHVEVTCTTSGDQAQHLEQAAAHLEAAGCHEEAQAIRAKAAAAKMEALESEIEKLRQENSELRQKLKCQAKDVTHASPPQCDVDCPAVGSLRVVAAPKLSRTDVRPAPPAGIALVEAIEPARHAVDEAVAIPAWRCLTNDDVTQMLGKGLSEPIIANTICNCPTRFDLSPEAVQSLKDAGATDEIIRCMRKGKVRQALGR